MRTYCVSHSLADGFQLRILEVPASILLIENHWPGRPSGWPVLGEFYWRLTNVLFRWTDKFFRTVTTIPIDRATADVIDPDAWNWIDDEDDD